MEMHSQGRQKSFCGPNRGLDSLAEAASCRTEALDEDPDSGHDKAEKQAESSKEQKGKVRKAYTITKQRERWTDGEHERFLQALKRYGRAWRKIEEHIGTKTAVQIRSHAQKFFSKLQREQSTSGGPGEESSKAGISIPPPRPKRKPSHPYPRKHNTSSEIDQSNEMVTEKETPSTPTQPSSTPSFMSAPVLQSLAGRNPANMSLSQVLESAAAAAAFAWSQVVSTAGPRVQQQLQAHVAAHQGGQAMYGMQPQQSNAAVLPSMYPKQRQTPLHESQANNPPSGSHYGHQSMQSSMGHGLYSSSPPNIMASAQESPNEGGNATAAGNERDSACSREASRGAAGIPGPRPATAPTQGLGHCWKRGRSPSVEGRTGTSRSMMHSRAQSSFSMPAHHLLMPGKLPSRSASAAAALGHATPVRQPETQRRAVKAASLTECKPRGQVSQDFSSDISQMAHFYQQAAAHEQKTRDTVEIKSTAGNGGQSGSGSGVSANDAKRSDKGSNNNNTTSGSDDGQANGSGSDGTTATADLMLQEGKGSDDGSNSPADLQRRSPEAPAEKRGPAIHTATHSDLVQPLLFGLGSVNPLDPSCLASSTSRWPAQSQLLPGVSVNGQQSLPQALTQQQLASYQQQALQAWAAASAQAQQSAPNYAYLQSMMNSLQGQAAGTHSPEANLIPASLTGKHGQLEPKPSDVPSMDTCNASTLSFSVPAFTLDSDGMKQRTASIPRRAKGEEQSGFKPYSKKHGMPVSSLPPTKRFAAAASATPHVDRPTPLKVQPLHPMYTPFSSFNAQGTPITPGMRN